MRSVCALILLVSLLSTAYADAGETAPLRVSMRDTGYVLGDSIEQQIEFKGRGARFDPLSMPPPGRITPWLELRGTHVETGVTGPVLIVSYQVFAAVEQAMSVRVPELKLRVIEGDGAREIVVPAQPFYLSPVLPPQIADGERTPRSAPPPPPLPTAGHVRSTLLAAAMALLFSGYLAWVHDRIPFLPRNPGPFARLARQLRRRQAIDDARLALLLHEAFIHCAGETLYPATLPRLFDRAPHLESIRTDIESFFVQSWQVHYGQPGAEPVGGPHIARLIRQARDCELGIR